MLRRNNAARLQETVQGVETMTRFSLAVLALASGVYTYLGVRGLLDGTATFVFFAAIIYSAAVSVAIYAFWTFMLRFVPLVTNAGQRVGAVPRHGRRLLHDHGDVVLAQCGGARGLRRARAASGGQSRGICRRPRPGAWQCARGAIAAARRAARLRSLCQARRRRAQFRRAHRHHRLGLGGAAPDADVGADDRARHHHHHFARPGADAVRRGQRASRQDARAGLGHRRDRAALRPVRGGIGAAQCRHHLAAVDRRRARR